jgi:hypothetical protein
MYIPDLVKASTSWAARAASGVVPRIRFLSFAIGSAFLHPGPQVDAGLSQQLQGARGSFFLQFSIHLWMSPRQMRLRIFTTVSTSDYVGLANPAAWAKRVL